MGLFEKCINHFIIHVNCFEQHDDSIVVMRFSNCAEDRRCFTCNYYEQVDTACEKRLINRVEDMLCFICIMLEEKVFLKQRQKC